jgi:hypothetical protein
MQFSHMCILWLVEFFALLIYNIEIERNVNVVGIITFYGHLSWGLRFGFPHHGCQKLAQDACLGVLDF